MRIIKFFLAALLGTIIIGGLVILVLREVVLVAGASSLSGDYKSLLNKNYSQECMRQHGYVQDYFTQIRFTSNREYKTEVVCADFTSTPIVLESKKLPILLFKTSIGSGFVIDERKLPSTIKLSSLGRKIFVYTENGQMHSNYLRPADLDYELGPVSVCQAHDYQCCDLDVQSGEGEQLTRVNDCPKSCYTSCLLRPVVLSFNTRPALDTETRIVEVRANELVTFSYVVGDGKTDVFAGQIAKNEELNLLEKMQALIAGPKSSKAGGLSLPVTVTIDFGDGEIWQSNKLQDTIDHQYACTSQTCVFQVKLSASDSRGVLSVGNELTRMIIKVDR